MAWVDWWNNRQLLEPIGMIPSAEAEVDYSRSPGVGLEKPKK
jgi:hypothetical protein